MKKRKSEKEILKCQIDECKGYIEALDSGFNEVVEDALVDYYIYEKKAAEERCRYLSGLYSEMTLR